MDESSALQLQRALQDAYARVTPRGGVFHVDVKSDVHGLRNVVVCSPERKTFDLDSAMWREFARLCDQDRPNWAKWLGKLDSGYGTIAFDVSPSGRSTLIKVAVCVTYRFLEQDLDLQKKK